MTAAAKRMLPIGLMLIAFTWPPTSCNAWDIVVEIRCLETPPLTCINLFSVQQPYNGALWPDPVADTGWWWKLTARDVDGHPLGSDCQPTETTMDGWPVP